VINFDPKHEGTGLTVAKAPCRDSTVCPDYQLPAKPLKVLYVVGEEKQAEPRFTFVSKQIATVVTAGKTAAVFSVAGIKDDSVVLSGDNVDILGGTDGSGAVLPFDKGKVTVAKALTDKAKGPVSVTLQMQGANAGMTISITAQGKKGEKDTSKQSVRLIAVEK
jgi:hypothetical protein